MGNNRFHKFVAKLIVFAVCVPILVVFYFIKLLVDLFTLPMAFYYAYRIMRTLAHDVRTWKTVTEIAEESNTPLLETKRYLLSITKKQLLYRPRMDEVPHTWSQKERDSLYRTKPNEHTWQFYEFRLKISKFGAQRNSVEDEALLIPV